MKAAWPKKEVGRAGKKGAAFIRAQVRAGGREDPRFCPPGGLRRDSWR